MYDLNHFQGIAASTIPSADKFLDAIGGLSLTDLHLFAFMVSTLAVRGGQVLWLELFAYLTRWVTGATSDFTLAVWLNIIGISAIVALAGSTLATRKRVPRNISMTHVCHPDTSQQLSGVGSKYSCIIVGPISAARLV